MKKKNIGIISLNSPVILGLTALSLVVLLISTLTGGVFNRFLAIRYTSWLDPLMYLRLFTHVIAHSGFSHYLNNFLLILVVGPGVEEKYGSKNLLWMFAITAVVTGLVNVIFFKNVMLIGASGLVFMLILLASFTNVQQGTIPLTFILVGVFYIGQEIINGVFTSDNISQMAHIVGGLCGAVFGFIFNQGRRKKV